MLPRVLKGNDGIISSAHVFTPGAVQSSWIYPFPPKAYTLNGAAKIHIAQLSLVNCDSPD